jgi:beta-glucanase (GH16 family)
MKNKSFLALAVLIVVFFACSSKTEPIPVVVVQPPVIIPEPVFEIPKPANCGHNTQDSETMGWTKIFDENFNADLDKWTVWKGGAYNDELQMYKAENLSVKDGHLFIHAKKENAFGPTTNVDNNNKAFEYTSGRIESRELFGATKDKAVRIMARIQWPAGVGIWPAFWTYGDPWPRVGEIDILEARGHEPNKFQSVYHWGSGNSPQTNASINNFYYTSKPGEPNLTQCFFVYELLWEKDKLSIILDGKLLHAFADPQNRYIEQFLDKKHRVILNLAVGGGFFSNLDKTKITPNAVMMVDWVRVYTK